MVVSTDLNVGEMKTSLFVVGACVLLTYSGGAYAEPNDDVAVPPPVSGRSLLAPDSITSSDVLARIRLIQDNLELIRIWVGGPRPPKPLLRVQGADAREVFLQTYNLVRRARQLGFEHLRTPVEELRPEKKKIVPAINLERLNEVLTTVLRVKRNLGIEAAVAEKEQADNVTPTDVFNATVEAGRLLDSLLDKQTDNNDVFIITMLVHSVSADLHVQLTKKFLPPQTKFVPNKTNADSYRVLYRCYGLIRQIADAHGLDMLQFNVSDAQMQTASSNNSSELGLLLLAGVMHISRSVLKKEPPLVPFFTRRRYPAHATQRALHLELILGNLLSAAPKRSR